jgi:hypothetical protein
VRVGSAVDAIDAGGSVDGWINGWTACELDTMDGRVDELAGLDSTRLEGFELERQWNTSILRLTNKW